MGNLDFYSSEKWRELKQWAFDRSSVCEKCGSTLDLTVHHRNYHNFGGNETAEDLEVLCWGCHREFHETEEKFWVHLVNSIERLKEDMCDRSRIGIGMSSVSYLGIQNKRKYLRELYVELSNRQIARGSRGLVGIHECHLCVNGLDKHPFCKKRGEYGCIPSR